MRRLETNPKGGIRKDAAVADADIRNQKKLKDQIEEEPEGGFI